VWDTYKEDSPEEKKGKEEALELKQGFLWVDGKGQS